MRIAFWISVAVIAYTYFGYAGWLWLSSRWFPKAVKAATLHSIGFGRHGCPQ